MSTFIVSIMVPIRKSLILPRFSKVLCIVSRFPNPNPLLIFQFPVPVPVSGYCLLHIEKGSVAGRERNLARRSRAPGSPEIRKCEKWVSISRHQTSDRQTLNVYSSSHFSREMLLVNVHKCSFPIIFQSFSSVNAHFPSHFPA